VREVGFKERVKLGGGGGAVTVKVKPAVLVKLPEVALIRRL
jgi:hypothetical protein